MMNGGKAPPFIGLFFGRMALAFHGAARTAAPAAALARTFIPDKRSDGKSYNSSKDHYDHDIADVCT